MSSRPLSVVSVLAVFFAMAVANSDARAEDEGASDGAVDSRLRATELCIDAEIADRLAVKRKRRGAVERLFIKQARHEFSLNGGYYVSDLFSSTYGLGGSYAYHMTETTAVEFSYLYTHSNADIIDAVEAERGDIIDEKFAGIQFFESLLRWSPIYAKFRLGGHVSRFDVHLNAGVGVVDSPTSRGVVGVGGIGFELFSGKAMAFRLDLRDHVFVQELLAESFVVNDLSLTLGVSVFLPFRN